MTVGWYIHHHGTGHLRRFLAVRRELPEAVGLSSLPRPPELPRDAWVRLPMDAPAAAGSDPEAGGALHWAPLAHAGLRARMATIAAWVQRTRPAALVCDVSVEVGLYVRLMGVPLVWIAQRGRRTDAPHRLVYAAATVIAPWTAALADPGAGLPADTRFVGALSRYDARSPTPAPGAGQVLAVLGGGGHGVAVADVRAAARATPGWSWSAAGLGGAVGDPVRDLGRVGDVWPLLAAADVVVASAGSNLVAEVAAARRPLICVPQERPFGEQRDGAAALARAGLAETADPWPAAEAWPALLGRATLRDPAGWAQLHDGGAAARLAAAVREAACASA